MALNLNTSPYFDDYTASKKFERILFKPGVAVQARELTQLQTILQKSMSRFADHVFIDGTPILGAKGIVKKRDYIKINDLDASSGTVDNDDLANYIGDQITGSVTGLTATIDKVETGVDTDAVDKKTLYISYTGGDDAGTYLHFDAGETLTVTSTDSGRNGDTFVVDNGTDSSDVTRNYFGNGLFFVIEDGIIYISGYFVQHDNQEITLEKYKNNANTYVGVKLKDSLVTADDDSTLNDPATGTFNFNAPGADRYKITTEIAKLGLTADNDAEFVSLYKVEDGLITTSVKDDLDFYRIIGDILAERTYDESGNYVIKNFSIGVREHLRTSTNNGYLASADGGDSDKIAITVGDGIGMVRGRKRRFFGRSHLAVDKGINKVIEENFTTSTAYGNYVVVDEVAGNWDLADGDLVELYDTAVGAVTATTYSGASTSGTKIGQARVRQIKRESGTPGAAAAEYRLYLYDIRMYGGKFADVRTIYYNGTADGFADTVLESSAAVLKEPKFNQMVFRSPITATSKLNVDTGNTYDLNYTYQKEFTATVATDGTATITVSGNETFPYSSTPTQTQLDDEFVVVVQSAVTIDTVSYAAGRIFDVQTSNISSVSSTAINFDFGTSWSTATDVKIFVKVKVTDEAPVSLNALSGRYVTIDTSTHPAGADGPWNLGLPGVYKIEEVLVGPSSGSYLSSGTDVKEQFKLETGQTDNFYGHSKLVVKPSAVVGTSSKKITVKLSYLSPNYGSSNSTYFAVNSYPVDDTGASGIFTYEIPVYYSENLSQRFDLRDCIDFRPYVKKTATDTTSVGSASENPLDTLELDDTADYQFPIPTESFTTDAEYYQGRIDKVVLTDKGLLKSVKGDYSNSPTPPIDPADSMVLAQITIPPYPSISPHVAKQQGRPDLQVSTRLKQNRRFTMQDIGAIETRINRLEYYTAINFLERDTKDKLILDSSGNDRFKNGFFVERFNNYDLANRQNTDLNYAINPIGKYATANFKEENIDVVFDSVNSSSEITRKGNLVTLAYSHSTYKENKKASKFRNAVGDLLFNYVGDMEAYPPSDNYTTQGPDGSGERNVALSNFGDALEDAFDALGQIGLEGNTQLTMGQSTTQPDPIDLNSNGQIDANVNVNDRSRRLRGSGGSSASLDLQITGQVEESDIKLTSNDVQISTSQGDMLQEGSFGNVVTNIEFAKFMRPQIVTFVATRLKPNTRVFSFFDNDDVSTHCKQIPYANLPNLLTVDNWWSGISDTTNDFGDNLVTDSQGRIVVQFRIPRDTFRIGSRPFVLSDDSKNRQSFTTTSAQATFDSFGLKQLESELTISTQVPNIAVTLSEDVNTDTLSGIVTDVRLNDPTLTGRIDTTINIRDEDPLAQTFMVRETTGIFLSKIDLFFRNKPTTAPVDGGDINGVTVQIRETVNGFPGKTILPYANKFLEASDVNTSTTAADGTVTFNATTVEFDSLVYLKPGREYCFVILPQLNDPNYEVWVSELGENAVGTTQRILAEDTTTDGLLFTSSNNSTFTPFQDEDIKFKMYRAEFDLTGGDAVFTNGDIDYCKLIDFTSGYPNAGDVIHAFDVTLDTAGSGYAVNDVITLNTFGNGTGAKIKVLTVSSGAISTFEVENHGSGYTADGANVGQASTTGSGSGAVFDITTKTGVIEYFSEHFNVARIRETKENLDTSDKISNGTTVSTIDTIENKLFNKIQHNFGEIIFPGTGVSHQYTPTKPSGVSVKGNTDFDLTPGVNTKTDIEYAVYSKSNEVANLSSNKSFNSTATFSSTDSKLSPVIDLSRASYIITSYDINNDTTDEDGIKGGNANARYVSKTIILDDGQEAEDLQVFVDALIPQDAGIEVYGKFLSVDDDANFDNDLKWIEMELVATPKNDGLSQSSFVEYNYKLPTKGSAPSAGLNSGVFEYDIYRVSGSASVTGGSGYTSPPTVTFSGGTADKQAEGYVTLSGGAISSLVITNPGRYTATTTPTITLSGGGGTGGAVTSNAPALTTFSEFKKFAVKIVFKTSNTSNTPKVKNLRAIALQA